MNKYKRRNKSNGNQDAGMRIGFMAIRNLTIKDFLSLDFKDKGKGYIELTIGFANLKPVVLPLKISKECYADFQKLTGDKRISIIDTLSEAIYGDLNIITFWKVKNYDLNNTKEYMGCHQAVCESIDKFKNIWECHIEFLVCEMSH